MNRAVIALVFRCKVTGGQLATSDETEAFRWATETEIRGLTSEAYAVRVTDAMHDQSPAAIRQHDGIQLLRPDLWHVRCLELPAESLNTGFAVLDVGRTNPAGRPGFPAPNRRDRPQPGRRLAQRTRPT
jgi:hypothetical protein